MLRGGATGEGLSEHIREAYGFLVTNYDLGDEIFLLGFSRGAFTARSIAAMINSVGLLTVRGMDDFYAIFKDWENQDQKNYVSAWPNKPFPHRPNVKDVAYAQELESVCLEYICNPFVADVEIARSLTFQHYHQSSWRVGHRRYGG